MAEDHPLVRVLRPRRRTDHLDAGVHDPPHVGPVAVPLLRSGDGARDRPGALAGRNLVVRFGRGRQTARDRDRPTRCRRAASTRRSSPRPGALITRAQPPGELGALHHRGEAEVSGLRARTGDRARNPARRRSRAPRCHPRPRATSIRTDVASACLRTLTTASCAIRYRSAAMSASGVERSSSSTRHRPARRRRRVLQIEPERRHQPVTLQRRRTQLEQQRAESLDRLGDLALDLPEGLRRHRLGEPLQHLQAHVDGAHHLDRVVVDVGRDLPALHLLRVLQPLRELAALLQRAPQDVEAPPELVLGFLPLGDVEHDAAPEQDRAVLRRAPARPRRGSTGCARPSSGCGIRRGTASRPRWTAGACRAPDRDRRGAAACATTPGPRPTPSTENPRIGSICGLV